MREYLLELEGMEKSFAQGGERLRVLSGADLRIRKGEMVALIGPSGSGKSTLLYIAGLLDKADAGRVVVAGRDCTRMSDRQKTNLRSEQMGFVYQSHNLFADFDALENVMLPMLVAGKSRRRAGRDAMALLDKMGLVPRAAHRPAELSGGEQQRVAIARALANSPGLLLADEPTGNLDPYNSEAVFEELLRMVSGRGMAVLVATHNPALAARMGRRVALVEGGLVDIGDRANLPALEKSAVGRKILESFG